MGMGSAQNLNIFGMNLAWWGNRADDQSFLGLNVSSLSPVKNFRP